LAQHELVGVDGTGFVAAGTIDVSTLSGVEGAQHDFGFASIDGPVGVGCSG
jgi:hypothetical protein